MSANEEPSPEPAKKGKGGIVKIAGAGVLLLGLGAGGAYGAFAAGLIGGSQDEAEAGPSFVRKGESDPYALPGGSKDADIEVVHGSGGSEYRTAYYGFTENFTANLADSPALIQVDLAVSTRRDGRVLMWVQNHELALRSAVLTQLAATTEADVYSMEGKQDLSDRLTAAINRVLEEQEGFGGIDAVHFKGFLVQ